MSPPRRKWSGEWHPLAERFPMLDEDELREMAASITAHGQFVPCRMDDDGLGLDGRNRVAACALAEVEPRWEVYEGEPISFIIAVNADRRHLTTGQRAMAVAIGLVDARKRRNGRFERGSVPDNPSSPVSDWKDRVRQAGLVIDHAPELADDVLAGGTALDAAHKVADARRKQKERVAALGGDLAKLVDSSVISLDEAERRAADAARLEQLADDLAERVRADTLSLDEAEAITAEREQRFDARAAAIRSAIETLGPMVGNPISPEMTARLNSHELTTLKRLLKEAKA